MLLLLQLRLFLVHIVIWWFLILFHCIFHYTIDSIIVIIDLHILKPCLNLIKLLLLLATLLYLDLRLRLLFLLLNLLGWVLCPIKFILFLFLGVIYILNIISSGLFHLFFFSLNFLLFSELHSLLRGEWIFVLLFLIILIIEVHCIEIHTPDCLHRPALIKTLKSQTTVLHFLALIVLISIIIIIFHHWILIRTLDCLVIIITGILRLSQGIVKSTLYSFRSVIKIFWCANLFRLLLPSPKAPSILLSILKVTL